MESEVLQENRASWQRFFEFVFPEKPKFCEKEPFGVYRTAKQPVLTENETEIQTKICTVFNEKPLVVQHE